MNNPVVSFGNQIPVPSDPKLTLNFFEYIKFDDPETNMMTYAKHEWTSDRSRFEPNGKGFKFFSWISLFDALDTTRPSVVSGPIWDKYQDSASGFVTPYGSMMAKQIVPSAILVDNGITDGSGKYLSYYRGDGAATQDLFNWELTEVNGLTPSGSDVSQYTRVAPDIGSSYISVSAKDDLIPKNSFTLELKNPNNPPLGSANGWLKEDSSDLVVSGAFQVMLNVTKSVPAGAEPGSASKNPWKVELSFGDVILSITDGGACRVTVLGEGDGNTGVANLVEAKTKEGMPQQQKIIGKTPYLINVYPVWNGIIVTSGVQESPQSVKSSSCYVPKLRAASIQKAPYGTPFDPKNPAPIEVGVGPDGPESVLVKFGDTMTAYCENCKVELAYVPCLFTKLSVMDYWRTVAADTEESQYTYNIYPVWTKNGTAMEVGVAQKLTLTDIPGAGGNFYAYALAAIGQLTPPAMTRRSAEIFGMMLHTIEEKEYTVKNGNGAFFLTWTGGGGGGAGGSGGWKDYVQSVSVNVSVAGSSGSVTIDRLGAGGQGAYARQSVGAFTMSVDGGYGTQSGSIFQGLAMGTADAKDTSGGTWTIPLVGLEKKLDDIALINPPLLDGYKLGEVIDFLSKYAGLVADTSNADTNVEMPISESIDKPRFDWKTGTPVREALEETMNETNHLYVVRDGVIFFYQANAATGLPLYSGTDWAGQYPNTKIVMEDISPDFEDLRNEVVIGMLQPIPDGQNTEWDKSMMMPRIELVNQNTVPDIPWARSQFKALPGNLTEAEAQGAIARMQANSSSYVVLGKTTIPGNADIKPYDRWGWLVIYGVSHNVDLQGKKWTTDLEFMSSGV